MGIYFEPPPQKAEKAWAIMELSGYRFPTEGSKAFIGSFVLTQNGPTLESFRCRIELLKKQDDKRKIKLRAKMYKEERRRHGGPKAV